MQDRVDSSVVPAQTTKPMPAASDRRKIPGKSAGPYWFRWVWASPKTKSSGAGPYNPASQAALASVITPHPLARIISGYIYTTAYNWPSTRGISGISLGFPGLYRYANSVPLKMPQKQTQSIPPKLLPFPQICCKIANHCKQSLTDPGRGANSPGGNLCSMQIQKESALWSPKG